jgi:hypothetical protein
MSIPPEIDTWAGVSPSQINDFNLCPRRWWKGKRFRSERDQSAAAQRGSLGHLILETYAETGRLPTHDHIRGMLQRPEFELARLVYGDNPNFVPRMHSLCASIAMHLPTLPVSAECIEHGFIIQTPNLPVPMRGFIDFIDPEQPVVTDYKFRASGRYLKSPSELRYDPQAKVYSAVYEALRRAPPSARTVDDSGRITTRIDHPVFTAGVFRHLNGLTDRNTCVPVVFEYTAELAEQMWVEIEEQVLEMYRVFHLPSIDLVPANPGDACKAFGKLCPVYAECMDTGNFGIDDEAVECFTLPALGDEPSSDNEGVEMSLFSRMRSVSPAQSLEPAPVPVVEVAAAPEPSPVPAVEVAAAPEPSPVPVVEVAAAPEPVIAAPPRELPPVVLSEHDVNPPAPPAGLNPPGGVSADEHTSPSQFEPTRLAKLARPAGPYLPPSGEVLIRALGHRNISADNLIPLTLQQLTEGEKALALKLLAETPSVERLLLKGQVLGLHENYKHPGRHDVLSAMARAWAASDPARAAIVGVASEGVQHEEECEEQPVEAPVVEKPETVSACIKAAADDPGLFETLLAGVEHFDSDVVSTAVARALSTGVLSPAKAPAFQRAATEVLGVRRRMAVVPVAVVPVAAAPETAAPETAAPVENPGTASQRILLVDVRVSLTNNQSPQITPLDQLLTALENAISPKTPYGTADYAADQIELVRRLPSLLEMLPAGVYTLSSKRPDYPRIRPVLVRVFSIIAEA